MKTPEVGQDIYVESSFHISNGSADVRGGLARVTKVENMNTVEDPRWFVSVAEHPGRSCNWTEHLSKIQDRLKEKFGSERARPDPDIDTPWISSGDTVNGKPYHGPDIW